MVSGAGPRNVLVQLEGAHLGTRFNPSPEGAACILFAAWFMGRLTSAVLAIKHQSFLYPYWPFFCAWLVACFMQGDN